MSDTKELDRMAEVRPVSQATGEFLEWLQTEEAGRIALARHHFHAMAAEAEGTTAVPGVPGGELPAPGHVAGGGRGRGAAAGPVLRD